jgi:glycine/D-amino acid oxidase-like deaminating enzyme
MLARTQSRKVAILGAGMQGCCVALELARRGHEIDLFDRCSQPATQAAAWNEGKIHLGLVYGNDPTSQTFRRMLQGALHFEAYLTRWLDGPLTGHSSPFLYGVHPSSMLSSDEVERHFSAVGRCYDELREGSKLSYLGVEAEPLYQPMSKQERDLEFCRNSVSAAFRTIERAVNPRMIASRLRAAIAVEPRIRFLGGTEIVSLSDNGKHGFELVLQCGGSTCKERYRDIVNALWSGRLALDRSAGVDCRRSWLYRYKLGIIVETISGSKPVPSTTFVLGSYGDTVTYDDGTIYLSWYPECMVGTSTDIVPPDFNARISETDRIRVAKKSIEAMAELLPALAPYRSASTDTVNVGGGIIFAWGAADIDQPDSELHRRYDIGVHSKGRYHSVDTGKYTMAPYFAVETCDRIEGML